MVQKTNSHLLFFMIMITWTPRGDSSAPRGVFWGSGHLEAWQNWNDCDGSCMQLAVASGSCCPMFCQLRIQLCRGPTGLGHLRWLSGTVRVSAGCALGAQLGLSVSWKASGLLCAAAPHGLSFSEHGSWVPRGGFPGAEAAGLSGPALEVTRWDFAPFCWRKQVARSNCI